MVEKIKNISYIWIYRNMVLINLNEIFSKEGKNAKQKLLVENINDFIGIWICDCWAC